MTVTQRRVRADPGKADGGVVTEPGIKYTCDCCGVDITHTVRIKCNAKECEEVDLCPICFSEGKEVRGHKAWHDYKVVEQHSLPIFSPDWGADEELLLISGLILNGLGNWAEVASHIGTRTKEECEKHYLEVYLGVEPVGGGKEAEDGMDVDATAKRKREFMPPMDMSYDIDPDEFQVKKKARIEALRKPHGDPVTNNQPMVSAPTNHEVAGYMPGRLEFEHEVDNDAELAVKDFEFNLVYRYGGDEQPQAKVTQAPGEGEAEEEEDDEDDDEKKGNGDVKPEPPEVKDEPDDQPKAESSAQAGSASPSKPDLPNGKGKEKAAPEEDLEDEDELEVKLALLEIYFSKLDKREEAKDLIFDRGLTEYKKIQANERRRPKDERELIHRYKVFAKLQTAQDFEVLTEGLIFEQNLRKRIAELQDYRRNGITTGAEAESYETNKAARAGYRPMPARDRAAESLPSGARINAGQHRFLHGMAGTPPPGAGKHGESREATPRAPVHIPRKPPTPLNLSNAASLDLLSTDEQSLCSTLRVLPKPYLLIKELYIRENERRKGLLKRRDARKMLKIDVNKSGRIFDFLVSAGMLILSYDPTIKQVYPPTKDAGGIFGIPLTVDIHNGQAKSAADPSTVNGEINVAKYTAATNGVINVHPVNGVNGTNGHL